MNGVESSNEHTLVRILVLCLCERNVLAKVADPIDGIAIRVSDHLDWLCNIFNFDGYNYGYAFVVVNKTTRYLPWLKHWCGKRIVFKLIVLDSCKHQMVDYDNEEFELLIEEV